MVTGEEIREETEKPSSCPVTVVHCLTPPVTDSYLNTLSEELQATDSPVEKAKIHNLRGDYYVKLAKQQTKANYAKSLEYWIKAREAYKVSLELMGTQNELAEIAYGRCCCIYPNLGKQLNF